MTRKGMKAEAISRMETLGLPWEIIKKFGDEDTVFVSDEGKTLKEADEDLMNKIHELEKKWSGVVYYAITSILGEWKVTNLLWVSKYSEDWEFDWENLRSNIFGIKGAFAYVINPDVPEFSEFGTIYIGSNSEGLYTRL